MNDITRRTPPATRFGYVESRLVWSVQHLTSHRHGRRIAQAWKDDPDLTGRTPSEVLQVVGDLHHHENPRLFAALVRRSHDGDRDATLLAIAALAPGLGSVVQQHHRGDPGAFDELVTQTVEVMARADPAEPSLYAKILGRVRATPTLAASHPREVPLSEPAEPTSGRDSLTATVLARLTLDRLVALTADPDVVPPEAWRMLLTLRIDGQPDHTDDRDRRSRAHQRADASRLARRLARRLAA